VAGSSIIALGHYQPTTELTNQDLAERLNTSDEWISQRVGIRSRRIAAADETVDDMAVAAAKDVLGRCPASLEDIDMVIVATCTAVGRIPNMAARVAATLGMPGPVTMDLNTACSGFTHALAVADSCIRTGSASTAMVIGADKMTESLDWTDRSSAVLFGDGAGAAVVTASEQAGIGPVHWGSVPTMGRAVLLEGTPSRFSQDGQAVYRWALSQLPQFALAVCERSGIDPLDLGAVVMHQANLRIIETITNALGARNAVVAADVVESGNTTAASIPLALSKLVARGEVGPGAPVLLFGFGGGLAFAGQVIQSP
jgi:3-oxoacyl-[acyl-carrier-protein] synthase-3